MAYSKISNRRENRAKTETSSGRGLKGIVFPFFQYRKIGWLFVFVLIVLLAQNSKGQGQNPPLEKLVEKLQAKYDSVNDFSADFEHTYAGGLLRTIVTERGTVQIKKPGKMRWDYQFPEKKLFISDGETLYSYLPADRQVILGTIPPNDSTTPALFLAGRARFSDSFNVSYANGEKENDSTWTLQLIPKATNADYKNVLLTVSRKNMSIVEIRSTDFQDAVSTIIFSSLKENVEPAESLFTFDPPTGTEVITNDRILR